MTTIGTQTNSAAQTSTAQASPSSSTATDEGAAAITSDFETFLRMLTVQAQNQDPLNPLDSTDFAVQLATFSGVEQQVRTNDLLERMIGAVGGNELAQLAGWVGMDARSAAPAVFDGAPIWVEVAPVGSAARAELRVYDETGALWDQFDIPVQTGPYIWDGTRADGSAFPDGVYTFEVVSYGDDDSVLRSEVAQTYNRVIEALIGANGPEFLLGNGVYIPSSDVTALRKPVEASNTSSGAAPE